MTRLSELLPFADLAAFAQDPTGPVLDVLIRDGTARSAEELLAGIEGLTPKRREALLGAFPTVTALVHASAADLQSTPGIGKGTAELVAREILA